MSSVSLRSKFLQISLILFLALWALPSDAKTRVDNKTDHRLFVCPQNMDQHDVANHGDSNCKIVYPNDHASTDKFPARVWYAKEDGSSKFKQYIDNKNKRVLQGLPENEEYHCKHHKCTVHNK